MPHYDSDPIDPTVRTLGNRLAHTLNPTVVLSLFVSVAGIAAAMSGRSDYTTALGASVAASAFLIALCVAATRLDTQDRAALVTIVAWTTWSVLLAAAITSAVYLIGLAPIRCTNSECVSDTLPLAVLVGFGKVAEPVVITVLLLLTIPLQRHLRLLRTAAYIHSTRSE